MTAMRFSLLGAMLCAGAPAMATPPLVQATGLDTVIQCVMRDETHIAIVNNTGRTIPAGRQIAYETVGSSGAAASRGGWVGNALFPGSLVQLEVGPSSSCRAWLPSSRIP